MISNVRAGSTNTISADEPGCYENPEHGFASYFVAFSGGGRLELMQMPGIAVRHHDPARQYIGWAHLAFDAASEIEVDALTTHLRADGVAVIDAPRRTGDGYYESVVLDPDGNRIEITAAAGDRA